MMDPTGQFKRITNWLSPIQGQCKRDVTCQEWTSERKLKKQSPLKAALKSTKPGVNFKNATRFSGRILRTCATATTIRMCEKWLTVASGSSVPNRRDLSAGNHWFRASTLSQESISVSIRFRSSTEVNGVSLAAADFAGIVWRGFRSRTMCWSEGKWVPKQQTSDQEVKRFFEK